jgi:membrane protease YdiL (CAAX protease family)
VCFRQRRITQPRQASQNGQHVQANIIILTCWREIGQTEVDQKVTIAKNRGVVASAGMSTTQPVGSESIALQPDESTLAATGITETPRRRVFALILVLFVSFGHYVVSSWYSMIASGSVSYLPQQNQARLLGSLVAQVGSLGLLWYVLSGQNRSWKSIGWAPEWKDIAGAVGLLVGSGSASRLILIPIQILYRSYFGHYLAPKSLHSMLGFGISALSIVFVCVNPFFEELIVRAYLMSEILDLGGRGVLAVVLSVVVQMSYHLYQGLEHGIALTVIFLVSSIYFLKTRRITPVILAHLCMDVYGLIRPGF